MRRMSVIGVAGILALAAGCAAPSPTERSATVAPTQTELDMQVQSGRAIAQTYCSECHAVGLTGESPRPDALPLRRMGQRVPLDALESDFAEGVRIGHADMPQFRFDLDGVDALLAYMRAIQEPAES